jgi:hypothetical protein
MTLNFNLQGAERKNLVQAISTFLEAPAVYLKTPTYAFQVGEYHIDRHGLVTGADNRELADFLQENGHIAETAEYEAPAEAEAATLDTTVAEAETGADEANVTQDGDTFTIEMPLTGFDPGKLDNLCRMVTSKETLLKAALDTEALPIQQRDDKLRFPWWNRILTGEEVEAYSTLISLLCKTAKEKARVTAKDGGMPINPKYAMRCYLLSLGFIGAEYKDSRRTILSRLEGNSSWKNGRPSAAADDEPAAPVEIKSERELILGQLPEGTKILRMYNAAENGELRVITDEDGEKRYVVTYEDGIPVITHKP